MAELRIEASAGKDRSQPLGACDRGPKVPESSPGCQARRLYLIPVAR